MTLKAVLCLCACLFGISVVQGKHGCKDVLRGCRAYPRDMCHDLHWSGFMERNCGNTCGYCNCSNWKWGCCRNTDVRADGPNKKGCPKKLCYDREVMNCREVKRNGLCDKEVNKETCPWSCGTCMKMPAPAKICRDIGYGCCWDGSSALGPNKKGCPPCVDQFKHACRQFKVTPCSNTGAYYTRSFLEKYCHETCGRCPKCRDREPQYRCSRYLKKGYCYHQVWRPYLKSSCKKTCGFCKERNGILA